MGVEYGLGSFVTSGLDGTDVYAVEWDWSDASKWDPIYFVSYNVRPSNERPYVVHFNKTMEERVTIKALGLERGENLIVGVCLPTGASQEKIKKLLPQSKDDN